jgi:Ala-tRNA(Pro) deacylase
MPKFPAKIQKYLEKSNLKHLPIEHRKVFTAFDKAATLKIKPAAVAKVLVVKMDGELALAVIGGDKNLDVDKLLKLARPQGEARQKAAKAKKIDFVKEKVIAETFKGIDPGAVPAFGALWNIKVFFDKKLLEQPKIILSAGSYETSIKMAPGAFKKISPDLIIGNFSVAKPKIKKLVKSALNKKKK